MSNFPKNMPVELSKLLIEMAADFPSILKENLVGIYLWGSLTYAAFDESVSDADLIVVIRKDINDREFSVLEDWFARQLKKNAWTEKLDLRFVIDQEFLDKNSKCCSYHFGKLTRHGSDGNPIIWVNIGQSGVTLWGIPAAEIAPEVAPETLNDALRLELEYLKEDLAANAGDNSDLAFFHNSYAVLTACRIFYTAHKRELVSKEIAKAWTLEKVAAKWQEIITIASRNRLAGKCMKTAELETDALDFVRFIEKRVKGLLPGNTS